MVRLRFWALCQLVYGAVAPFFDPHERRFRRAMRADPALAEVGDDDPLGRMARRDLLRSTVLRGHLARLCFESLWKDFRTLKDPDALGSDEWLVQVARTQLLRLVEEGPKVCGFLRGYLRAQLRHLEGCAACQAKVCGIVREDVRLAGFVRDLMHDRDPGDPPDRDRN
jgi:hypothetical protein